MTETSKTDNQLGRQKLVDDKLGRGISYEELKTGDLFFFTTKAAHNALYMALESFDFEGCRLCTCGDGNKPLGCYATAQVRVLAE